MKTIAAAVLTAALILGIQETVFLQQSVAADGADSVDAVSAEMSEEKGSAADDTQNDTAVISLSAEGNTVYIDAQGIWSTIQGSVVFDPANKVADCGIMETLKTAASDQHKLSIPVENLMEGEYAFAGIFSSLSGEGIEYTGHAFYMTFESIDTPIELTLKDTDGTVLETFSADGSTPPPTPVPEVSEEMETESVTEPAAEPVVKDTDAARAAGPTYLVIAGAAVCLVVLVVVILAVRGKKRKKEKEDL